MGVAERRAREKEARRLQIMDAAKKVFSAKGFSGATMEEIAERAELSPATLYLYFKNKHDLFASLNLRMLHHLVEQVEWLKNRPDQEPADKIRGFAEAMYEVYEFDPLILINVFHLQASEGLNELSPEMVEEINGLSAKALRTIAQIFEQGIQEGVFEDHHPTALGDIVWSLFAGLVLWEESKRFFDPAKRFLKPTLELAMKILAKGVSKG